MAVVSVRGELTEGYRGGGKSSIRVGLGQITKPNALKFISDNKYSPHNDNTHVLLTASDPESIENKANTAYIIHVVTCSVSRVC